MGLVDIALAEFGRDDSVESPKGSNSVKYNTWFYDRAVSGSSYPWCAVFVSWCAMKSGEASNFPKTASVSEIREYFSAKNRYKPKGYKPQPGDIMINNGDSHTGIVYDCDDTTFYTIEGNSSDKVSKCSYPLDHSNLAGFCKPDYTNEPMDGKSYSREDAYDNSSGTIESESLGVKETKYVNYTVVKGDTLSSIASKYNTTVAMIIFLNNLTSTTIYPGQKLKVPKNSGGSNWSDASSGTNPIAKTHTKMVTVSHPTVKVEFYTETGLMSATLKGMNIISDSTLHYDLISVNTRRGMSDDCPTFTMNLVYRNEWYSHISSNDLVIIKMQRPPEVERIVMFGLVDDIRKSTDYSGGAPQRTVQVTGRGFNKAFVNFAVGLIEGLSIDEELGFNTKLFDNGGKNSHVVIESLINSYVGKAIQYTFGNGATFQHYFGMRMSCYPGEKAFQLSNYTSFTGNLWNLIKELSNAPFNETFWETDNGKAMLIHRKTPFNKAEWIHLPRLVIPDSELVADNTGRSDLETYTLFRVDVGVLGQTYKPYNPLWYKPFYAKYGINMLEVVSSYDIEEKEGKFSAHKDLFNWNIRNNVFSNGQLTVQGKASYKIGERVILEDSNMEYYVEGVSHSFNMYQSWTTTLDVTRGIEPEQRFQAPWDCYEEFTPREMNAIALQTSGTKIDWSKLPKVNNTIYTPDSGNAKSASGKTITIPSGLGNIHTYMGWQCITSPSSAQYKLREQAGQKFSDEGFGMINGCYVVACTTTYGQVGDYIDVYKDTGLMLPCIIGDIKNTNDPGCNKWGHNDGRCIIEFVVDKTTWYPKHDNPGTSGCRPNFKGYITKIVNRGSYFRS